MSHAAKRKRLGLPTLHKDHAISFGDGVEVGHWTQTDRGDYEATPRRPGPPVLHAHTLTDLRVEIKRHWCRPDEEERG